MNKHTYDRRIIIKKSVPASVWHRDLLKKLGCWLCLMSQLCGLQGSLLFIGLGEINFCSGLLSLSKGMAASW
jgi:hypothetical protein